MSSTTPNLSLTLYDSTTDQSVSFATFRAVWGGPALTSNFYKIDTAYGVQAAQIASLTANRGAITVASSFISANYYEASGITAITSYATNMNIILSVDTTSSGTVTLNINSLGTKSVSKVDSSGAVINLTGSDLVKGRQYLFTYNGTQWLWVSANSADQIQIVGTAGNFIKIGSTNNLEDSTYGYSTFALAAKGVTNGDSHDHVGGDGAPIINLPESISFTGDISPSQITSNQDNYNPTSLSTASTLRINSDAARDITGLAGGSDGRIIIIHNIGSFTITLKNSSGSSTSSNQFLFSADVTVLSTSSVVLQYDSTSSKWRLFGGSGSGGSSSFDLSQAYALLA